VVALACLRARPRRSSLSRPLWRHCFGACRRLFLRLALPSTQYRRGA